MPNSDFTDTRWKLVQNTGSSTCPPYCCLQVTTPGIQLSTDGNSDLLYIGTQPNGSTTASFLFAGPTPIPAGDYGAATFDVPALAAWDTGTPAVGETWGPKSGQWTLSKGQPGFTVVGVVDATRNLMLAVPCCSPCVFEGNLYATLTSSSATGQVTPTTAVLGSLPPNSGSTAYPLTCNNDFGIGGASGKKVLVCQGEDGTFYIIQGPVTSPGGITFTLKAGLSGGSAAATVGTAWGSAPDAAGASVTERPLDAQLERRERRGDL